MTLVAWAFIACTVLPVALLVWAFISVDSKSSLAVRSNLSRGITRHGQSAPTFGDRGMLELARKFTPAGYAAKLDELLARAGRPASMPLPRFLVAKPLLALAGAVVGSLGMAMRPGAEMALLGLFLTILFYFIPDLVVISKAQERQTALQMELPDTMDQMLIAVEAGLGFESAMARAGANGKGPMAEELMRTLQDMQMGRPRRDAYEALAARTSVSELKSFVRAVVQADIYGIGIAQVLRTQAKQMRVKRRQRAEEKAMKLPVLILFPLLFFVFPTLFLIIMGPGVINMIPAFSGGGLFGG